MYVGGGGALGFAQHALDKSTPCNLQRAVLMGGVVLPVLPLVLQGAAGPAAPICCDVCWQQAAGAAAHPGWEPGGHPHAHQSDV